MDTPKKDRFEVFKRDGFQCAYCGRKPPAVTLEVDHILPLSAGGPDTLDNKITACFDCNRGKGKIPLSQSPASIAEKMQSVREREEQYRALLSLQKSVKARENREIKKVEKLFADTFPGSVFTEHFRISVRSFLAALGREEVLEAMSISRDRIARNPENCLRYFCGICWRKIKRGSD